MANMENKINLQRNNSWNPASTGNSAVYFNADGMDGYTFGSISIDDLTALRDRANELLAEWEEKTAKPNIRAQVAALAPGTMFRVEFKQATGTYVKLRAGDTGKLLITASTWDSGLEPYEMSFDQPNWLRALSLEVIHP